jgi:tRNA-dihydrouridine synthase C
MPHQSPGRLKQWLGLMRRSYPQAEMLYRELRELRMADELSRVLERNGIVANRVAVPCP